MRSLDEIALLLDGAKAGDKAMPGDGEHVKAPDEAQAHVDGAPESGHVGEAGYVDASGLTHY